MNILIVGSGGREHALATAYSKSKKIKQIIVAPGNALISYKTVKVKVEPNVAATDFDGVLKLVKKYKIDLVDVAADDQLAEGFVDRLQALGIKAFGPAKNAAEIEWNKDWSRHFMAKYKLPVPSYRSFSDAKKAIAYVNSLKEQVLYIKASGLALGKGAIRAENKKEAIVAINSMKNFGKAGETFLIEECMVGEEFSLFAICDGRNYQIVGTAQDHKTVYDHDKGPNTGGMGCVSSPKVVTSQVLKQVEQTILKPFMKGMKKEGRAYVGILYLGAMVTHSASSGQAEIGIVEFNSRWGDPEAEVLIPSIKTDYLTIVENALNKRINKVRFNCDKLARLSVAGCSLGYPVDYSKVKGKVITGLEKAAKLPGVTIFGAGIAKKGKNFIAHGGRVFHVVGEGKTLVQAREKAYKAMAMIDIQNKNLHFRSDIGWRDLERGSL
jgi:phosphoribosylamine--glycine ligase